MSDEQTDETVIISDIPAARALAADRRRACLIVVAGRGVGEVFVVDRPLMVGRGLDADLRIEDAGISRRHARFVQENGQVVVEDLGSTNGTFVNGSRVDGRLVLADGDKLQFGTSTILRFQFQDPADEAFQRQMFELASRDVLTGALNRRYFLERLDAEIAHVKRYNSPLTLLLFDIDHFKQVNDRLGHPAGDRILRGVSDLAAASLRSDDVLARYGGEEFAVLMPSTDLPTAIEVAERLRQRIEAATFDACGTAEGVTVSIGVATLALASEASGHALLTAADEALYRAKRRGRNRVEV